jgi:hypothetical protein
MKLIGLRSQLLHLIRVLECWGSMTPHRHVDPIERRMVAQGRRSISDYFCRHCGGEYRIEREIGLPARRTKLYRGVETAP